MLYSWLTVGNRRKVVPAELFLRAECVVIAHAEWTMVRGNDLQIVGLQPGPQSVLMSGCAVTQGGRAYVFGTVEPIAEIVEIEEEILRAGLCEDVLALVSRLNHVVERFLGREVDDVERGACGFRQFDARCVASPSRIALRTIP